MKIHQLGAQFFYTEGRTNMMKLTVTFRNSAKRLQINTSEVDRTVHTDLQYRVYHDRQSIEQKAFLKLIYGLN
jgi:hypothetical protein